MDILDLIRAFMVEHGWSPNELFIEDRNNEVDRRVLLYRTWAFAIVRGNDQLFFLPFKTNHPLFVSPADPNFFMILEEALELPGPGHKWHTAWHKSYGPVAQKSGARDS